MAETSETLSPLALKSLLGIFQIVVLALLGWALQGVINHGDRLTLVEARVDSHSVQSRDLTFQLRESELVQRRILEELAGLRPAVQNLQQTIAELSAKIR